MRRARVRHFVYMEIIRGCQMETITSRENAKIKYACRLREEEKLRTADGLFFAEGPKLCLELARGCTLQTLYATEKALAHTPELEAFAGKTVLVTEPVAQKLSGTKTSQDVFGVFEHPGWQAADILAKGRRILALEAPAMWAPCCAARRPLALTVCCSPRGARHPLPPKHCGHPWGQPGGCRWPRCRICRRHCSSCAHAAWSAWLRHSTIPAR
jgi:hypothetical protein